MSPLRMLTTDMYGSERYTLKLRVGPKAREGERAANPFLISFPTTGGKTYPKK